MALTNPNFDTFKFKVSINNRAYTLIANANQVKSAIKVVNANFDNPVQKFYKRPLKKVPTIFLEPNTFTGLIPFLKRIEENTKTKLRL